MRLDRGACLLLAGWAVLIMGPVLAKAEDAQLEALKARLVGTQISNGPDPAQVTRSPWGPELYQRTVDAVVLVVVSGGDAWEPAGTGAVISPACQIATNWHVIEGARKVGVIFRPLAPRGYETLSVRDVLSAEIERITQPADLALLRLKICRPETKSLALEDPAKIEVGQDVFTIGHPRRLHWSYTEGVISQIRPRKRWEIDGKQFVATVLQTQTPVSYGSSGGPLLNRDGKLVGIVSNSLRDDAGFNFAIAVQELNALMRR